MMDSAQISFSVVQGSAIPKVGERYDHEMYPKYKGWVISAVDTLEYEAFGKLYLDVMLTLQPVEV
jgi:hypothetical protein